MCCCCSWGIAAYPGPFGMSTCCCMGIFLYQRGLICTSKLRPAGGRASTSACGTCSPQTSSLWCCGFSPVCPPFLMYSLCYVNNTQCMALSPNTRDYLKEYLTILQNTAIKHLFLIDSFFRSVDFFCTVGSLTWERLPVKISNPLPSPPPISRG